MRRVGKWVGVGGVGVGERAHVLGQHMVKKIVVANYMSFPKL